MKISPGQVDRFITNLPPEIRGVLLYGPDRGLVLERLKALTATVVPDPDDPFCILDLPGSAVDKDPARLNDEAAAIALTGGRRVVRLRDCGDGQSKILDAFLKAPVGDALVLVEAADLPGRSALRKIFEAAGFGAAIACYRDDAKDVVRFARSMLQDAGIAVEGEALQYLVASLGNDRLVSRREIEKLILFKADSTTPLTFDETRMVVGDSAERTLEDLAFAVADGDCGAMERVLSRSVSEGVQAPALMRQVGGHFLRLHACRIQVDDGMTAEAAMARLRPPVFWKVKDRFAGQVRRWDRRALGRILDRLLAVERQTKQSGQPAELLARHTLHELTVWLGDRR